MTTDAPLLSCDVLRADNRLLEALQHGRDDDAARVPSVTGPRLDSTSAQIEQAKGALMLRYGVDSYQALALLVRWARVTHTPVPTVAHTLLRGICEGNPQTEIRHRGLVRWLEARLRDGDPDLAQTPRDRSATAPTPQTPRSR